MHKIDKKENPTFQKYSDEVVQIALKKDFSKKCYICEEVTRHYEVEHFYPQSKFPHLKNSYENLFYSCEKCNSLKGSIINTSSDNEILNCCDIDVENYIKLKYNSKNCNVEISRVSENMVLQTDNTIQFLEKIYNGKNSKSNSCEDLKNEIGENIENFRQKLDKYKKTRIKRVLFKELQDAISPVSAYSTFKYWIIKDDKNIQGIL